MFSRPANRAHTRAIIAQLRESGDAPRKRKVGRVPRPLPPTRIADEYAAAIRRHVCAEAREAFEREAQGEVLRALVDLRRHAGHMDATGERRDVRALVASLVEYAARMQGQPRRTPPIVLRPSLGAFVGDVQAAAAHYDPERDEITIGAVPLAMLRALCKRGRAETDADLLAVKVALHEGFHAASRRGAISPRAEGDEARAQSAVEDATAEIAAQLLTADAARAVGIQVDDGLALRWTCPLFRAVDGDVRLVRPTSYPAFVERVGRLAARAKAPDLLQWVLQLRYAKGSVRLALLSHVVGMNREPLVEYLAAERTGAG